MSVPSAEVAGSSPNERPRRRSAAPVRTGLKSVTVAMVLALLRTIVARVADHLWSGRHRLIAYGIPALCVLGATARWFSAGSFAAAGDVSPYVRVNLAHEVTSLWNHQASGGGSSYYAILQLPDVALLRATGALGLSGPDAQHLLFVTILSVGAVGSTYVARVWLRSPWSAALAGLVGVFNYFVLVALLNLLPVLAIGVVGLLVGRILRAAAGEPVLVRGTAALTLLAGYLAQNPPLLAVASFTVLGAALLAPLLIDADHRRGSARRAWAHLLAVLPWAVLLNLWWVVPFALTVFAGQGLTFAAQTNPGAWAWTQTRATLGNIAWLNTGWGWTEPGYYPYDMRADSGLSGVVHWVLPTLALIGLVGADRRRRRALFTLSGVTVVLVFLAKGTHFPAGAVNLWLYGHVPGFWLLRDPMSKLGVLLVLIYAVATGIAVERSVELVRATAARCRRSRPATLVHRTVETAGVAAVVLLAGTAVAAPWPLWTGAVVPSVNPLLAPARVAVPKSWYSLADTINRSTGTGKTLILPLDPFYQVTTTWGYHGADEIPAQLLRNPVLSVLPGGYYGPPTALADLLSGVQTAAVTGDVQEIPGLLRALGVSTVLVRSDIANTPETPTSADPAQLVAALAHTPGLKATAQAVVGSVFSVSDTHSALSAASTLVGVQAEDPGALYARVGSLPRGTVATSGDEPTSGLTVEVSAQTASNTFDMAAGTTYSAALATTSRAAFRSVVQRVDSHPVLSLIDADQVLLDGQKVPSAVATAVQLSSAAVVAISADGLYAATGPDGDPVILGPRQRVTAYAASPSSHPDLGAFGRVGDCHSGGPLSAATVTRASIPAGLTLSARHDSACVAAAVNPTTTTAVVTKIDFDYRVLAGLGARVCLYQNDTLGCADLPAPASSTPTWSHYTAVISLPAHLDAPRLFLYADGSASNLTPTTVSYRNISALPLVAVGSADVSTSSDRHLLTLRSGTHRAEFRSAIGASTPLAFSALGDCNAADPATAGLTFGRAAGGVLALGAASDSACVSSNARKTAGSSRFHIHLQYRTNSGLPARVCIWEIGPNTCAQLPPLLTSTNWATLDAAVTPDPSSRALQVYLYADGQQTPRTSVDYRDVQLERAAPHLLIITPVSARTRSAPALITTRISSSRWRAGVTDARGGFVLTLADSFASGWKLSGLPSGWTARHFVGNGYANSWLVSGTGAAVLTLDYSPARLAGVAQDLSLITLLLLGALEFTRVRPRRSVQPRRLASHPIEVAA